MADRKRRYVKDPQAMQGIYDALVASPDGRFELTLATPEEAIWTRAQFSYWRRNQQEINPMFGLDITTRLEGATLTWYSKGVPDASLREALAKAGVSLQVTPVAMASPSASDQATPPVQPTGSSQLAIEPQLGKGVSTAIENFLRGEDLQPEEDK